MKQRVHELVQRILSTNEPSKERDALLKEENEYLRAGNQSLMEEINFLKYRMQTLDELHESIVQKEWPHDDSMRKYGCAFPFTRIEILPRGEVYNCCSGYLKHNYYIENIYGEGIDEIWNSVKVKNLRKSVLEGNFEYCMKGCKYLCEIADPDNGYGGIRAYSYCLTRGTHATIW